MYNNIKRIVKETIDSSINMAILHGTVSSTGPLKIMIEQRFELPEEALIISEGVKELGLKIGDKVIVINIGMEYLIFDREG